MPQRWRFHGRGFMAAFTCVRPAGLVGLTRHYVYVGVQVKRKIRRFGDWQAQLYIVFWSGSGSSGRFMVTRRRRSRRKRVSLTSTTRPSKRGGSGTFSYLHWNGWPKLMAWMFTNCSPQTGPLRIYLAHGKRGGSRSQGNLERPKVFVALHACRTCWTTCRANSNFPAWH